jgi:hypothetical protein
VRRPLAAGIWLTLTVTATLIVWAAVSFVAADVTDRPAPVVAHRDVVVALQAGATDEGTTTTTLPSSTARPGTGAGTTKAPTSSTSAPAGGRTVTTISGGRNGPATGPVFGQGTAASASTVATPPPSSPQLRPGPTTTTTAAAVGGTATFSNAGGAVTVACTSFDTIRLVAALPNDGYQAVVVSSGGFYVQVNFVSGGTTLSISAACVFGQPFQGNQGH